MILEAQFDFAKQQALSGTADVVSTNVHDAGKATKLFESGRGTMRLGVYVTEVGGTNPTFRARLVGADNQALTTNPEIIADTGVTRALAAGDLPLVFELRPMLQKAEKRYYGVIFTLGGTSPTARANAQAGMDMQNAGLR